MSLANTIRQLKEKGFEISLGEDKVKVSYPGESPPEGVKHLLDTVRDNKKEVVRLLQAQGARALIEKQGWAAVQSETLGETVIWVRDERVIIPTLYRDNVKYTLEELEALAAEPKLSEEGLREVHEIKRMSGGTFEKTKGFKWPGGAD